MAKIKNILKKADEIVNHDSEEKQRQYGNFSECMTKASTLCSVMCNKDISPEDIYYVMIAVKLARQPHAHKQDNLLDAVAYLGALDNYKQNK